ncbi:MAG: 2-hydroxy-3-oxopropionate reductase [Myxococcales bacterium]|nr:2-hydroxy-3-oxopropionate reductase [Myxococcales bacterium]
MADTVVAFLGVGHMGRGMVRSLARQRFQLRVWDRTAAKAAALSDIAEVCATPRAAVAGVPFVMTSLADDHAVREVTFGEDGILDGMAPDAVHLGASTISRKLGQVLDEAHRRRGTHYVGSPVLGRPDAAERGELWILAGGEPDAVLRCRPIFEAIGQGTIATDSAAQAHLVKIIANFMIANTIEMLGEALALGEKGGIAPASLVDMLGRTILGSPVLLGYGARIARGEFEPAGFRLELGFKDVSLALAAGEELRAPLPLASLVHDHMIEAIAHGRGHQDWSALAAVAQAAAGLSVKA